MKIATAKQYVWHTFDCPRKDTCVKPYIISSASKTLTVLPNAPN